MVAFNCAIVEATKDLVCGYKPNMAPYERQGAGGIAALHRTNREIRTRAPKVAVLSDAKRGDTLDTNTDYAGAIFSYLGADCVTVNPYLGGEPLEPFLNNTGTLTIVLCRSSNPGAPEFQDLLVSLPSEVLNHMEALLERTIPERMVPLYQYVAYRVAHRWNKNGNCAVVVGANYPEELRDVRKIVGDMTILAPAVGFQQVGVPLSEQARLVVQNGMNSQGRGLVVNAARSIIFASNGPDFAEAAQRETKRLRDLINQYR